MNDFDRFLEHRLRHMLDPVVALEPPRRGRRKEAPAALPAPPAEAVVEPVAVTIPVTPLL